MMADLSEYEALNDIEFSQEVKQLMELFAESWEECRSDECGTCKYRHGKEMYQLLFCLSERYAEKLISNGFAQVRHGRWVEYENESDIRYHYCSECKHQAFNYDEGGCNVEILSDYCPNCGARMDRGDEDG